MQEKSRKKASLFSLSCGASVLMIFYMGMAMFNLYRLMHPLVALGDLSIYPPESFVGPLWKSTSNLFFKVYISKTPQFTSEFFSPEQDIAVLLWESKFPGSLSKSFLLCNQECSEDDPSFEYASEWLNDAEKKLEGGFLSDLKAGEGIESTSVLLVIWDTISKQIRTLMRLLGSHSNESNPDTSDTKLTSERSVVSLSSSMFSRLHSNSTLYVHVLVTRSLDTNDNPIDTFNKAARSNSVLLGNVNLIKYEPPHHVEKPKRLLIDDVKYVLGFGGNDAPWDLDKTQPNAYAIYQLAEEMKAKQVGYPYWKPEVSIKYVYEGTKFPGDYVGMSGFKLVQTQRTSAHPTGVAMLPSLHVDEIGLTSEKYLPLNTTLKAVPLRITVDRSDVESHAKSGQTATAGGMSPARWRLLSHLSESLEAQKQLGFEQSDIDDLRRLIADTNVTLLAITILASGLHLLFEFLTFKNEVTFWRDNKDLTGLSVRSLFLDMIGQVIILLFLIEKESSLLMIIPTAGGCLVALWKCQRGAGFCFKKVHSKNERKATWWNKIFRLAGFELRAMRLENAAEAKSTTTSGQNLTALTEETDRLATKTLGTVLLPLVLGYTMYSLFYEQHDGWYAWLITSASSAVYALGFVLMTPQLFLNYKLKSVAHLPWRVLVYKFLNTFIDDLFAFIIRMPTMARLSCFRDDIVFIIYLYQRWLYPVDQSRPIEGGDGSTADQGKKQKKE